MKCLILLFIYNFCVLLPRLDTTWYLHLASKLWLFYDGAHDCQLKSLAHHHKFRQFYMYISVVGKAIKGPIVHYTGSHKLTNKYMAARMPTQNLDGDILNPMRTTSRLVKMNLLSFIEPLKRCTTCVNLWFTTVKALF